MLDKVTVPEGKKGNYEVERFVVSETDAKFDAIRSGWRSVIPGEYTKLTRGGSVLMSDTPAEMRDHYEPIRVANGRCLINGLGLGYILQEILKKSEVDFVTVVEISQDVIDLVVPHYFEMFGKNRFEVICDDAYEFKPPKGIRYNLVWNDIWSDICTDNWEGYKKLHRKYGRRSDWVGSWMREFLKGQLRREKEEERRWGRYR